MVDKEVSFEDAVDDQLPTWQQLSHDMTFCTDSDISNCEVKEVYMIYLWLETLYAETFQRQQEGGNQELGVMPSLGSASFKQYYEFMSLEVPLITITHAFQDAMSTDSQFESNCTYFYENMTNNTFSPYASQLCTK